MIDQTSVDVRYRAHTERVERANAIAWMRQPAPATDHACAPRFRGPSLRKSLGFALIRAGARLAGSPLPA
jgi:hypothetical protein